ncbi:Vacuolar protein-sorting-associated protein 36 [Coemansia sp. RSA 1933]|nr:Vacuolar protein-sorting-associated protein 36 [Coemansia sp. RSA 1933]
MEPVEIAPTLRPLVESGEKIVSVQTKVGLYRGDVRDEEHDSGTVYLTTQRLVYVDQQRPHERSVELHLSHVRKSTLHSGFLYSSGKIVLELRPVRKAGKAGGSGRQQQQQQYQARGESRRYAWVSAYDSGAQAASGVGGWECSICESVNRDEVDKCGLCGVRRQGRALEEGAGGGQAATATATATATARCGVCTFDNHSSMARCEMCDTELLTPAGSDEAEEEAAPVPAETEVDAETDTVKLSFRGGGSSAFHAALKGAMESSTWLVVGIDAQDSAAQTQTQTQTGAGGSSSRPTTGGIATLVSAAHEAERARDATLRSAFGDLEALTAKANEIVGMAEQIATQLKSPAASKLRRRGGGESEEDTAERADAFRQYLLDLGIDSPVTKDTAGAAFHEELARELCDFLENYVGRCGGTVALVDAYCLYNRAREFALVYPADFAQACSKFARLRLPLRLREYPSGLLAIEDSTSASDALIISRIRRYIRSFGPVTAGDLAAIEDCPLPLAEERLWLCERAAQVCRDESVEGVRFYANAFVDGRASPGDEQWQILP